MTSPESPVAATSPALEEARQHRLGVRAAAEELEHALAAAIGQGSEWRSAVDRRVSALAQAFALHVGATENPDGLLAESVEANPRLIHRADQLRQDHREIQLLLERLDARAPEGEAATDQGAGQDPDSLRQAALVVLMRISKHRYLGSDLVYQAYMVDIEASD